MSFLIHWALYIPGHFFILIVQPDYNLCPMTPLSTTQQIKQITYYYSCFSISFMKDGFWICECMYVCLHGYVCMQILRRYRLCLAGKNLQMKYWLPPRVHLLHCYTIFISLQVHYFSFYNRTVYLYPLLFI